VAKQNQKLKTVTPQPKVAEPVKYTNSVITFPSWLPYFIVFSFSFLIYSNTLWNKYAIDDTIVVTDNKYTKKGAEGIKEIFTHDMFEGFFGERGAKLVSGGRYRPLSMASMALEYEVMRKIRGDKRDVIDDKNIIMTDNDPYLNPFLSHLINILLFAFTGLVLYRLLLLLMPVKKTTAFYASLPFIITMLYAAHPLHTEAVANIKGRDEVMCMLFSLMALYSAVKYVKTQNMLHLLGGIALYFIALLSKENAITFLAVIPLTYYFFTKAKVKDYLLGVGMYLLPVIIFMFIRSMYTQSSILGDQSPEILNNPFVAPYNTFDLRYGTTVFTFLKYYILMILPHPLTHDYYYNQVPYLGFGDIRVIASLLLTIGMVVYALVTLPKKSPIAFGILFFFITFSVASNVLFTVGVLMNERFIYMSTLGFCIMLAYALVHYIKNPKALLAVLVVVLSLYSYKTFSRNFDWKDSFTLFRRDAKYSSNSAKIQTSLGGDLTKAAQSNIPALRDSGMIKTIFTDLQMDDDQASNMAAMPDSTIRTALLDSSIAHLNIAVTVYPYHSNAWLLLGNAVYQRNHKPEEVIPIYTKAAAYRQGGYYDAYFNLGVVYNDINRPDSAKVNLLRAFEMKPEQVECRYLLAQTYAKLNQPDSAAYWLNRGNELRAVTSGDYYSLGKAFGQVAHNMNASIDYLKKAIAMEPKVEVYYEDLGVAYGINNQVDESIATSLKLIEINPKYPPAYMNLFVSYRIKGNLQLAQQYLNKYNELTGKKIPMPAK